MVLRFLFTFFLLLPGLFAEPIPPSTGKDARVGQDWVEIYGDFVEVPQNFGHSIYRALIHQVSLQLMQQSDSLWLANQQGWLTAVVLDRMLVEQLQNSQLAANSYVQDLGGIYRLRYQGIDIQFSFEPAPPEMLSLIRTVYRDLPQDAEAVVQHYQRNYVIRVYRAENVFNARQQDMDFSEAMVAATLVGDSYQMLWGIHDGYDLLRKIQ